MFKVVVLLIVALFCASDASTVGEHTGSDFCYREEDGCGPSSEAWPELCHKGTRQSPINLPPFGATTSSIPIKFSAYRGDHFRMQNNGHSIQIDFDHQGESTFPLKFSDPLDIHSQLEYIFAAAHFHWGVRDYDTGSEHCIAGICSGMEMHFVHYLSNYSSLAEAIGSGDENALAVIGVLIDVFEMENGSPYLDPIVSYLPNVEIPDNDTSTWVTVNETLDFSKMLWHAGHDGIYTYPGSLTTPGCNEQVNWYVLKNRVATSHQDLEAFRTIVKDTEGKVLTENHRPLQPENTRVVHFSKTIAY